MNVDNPSDPPRRSLIAVVAHPDDEVLIGGGTLALAAAAGAATGVVSLTRGEAGTASPGSLPAGETLADARERELGDAGRALGVHWARCLRHPDGALAAEDAQPIATELSMLLRPHEPAVLLTFGADGLYGHPDHLATRSVALLAAERLESRPCVLESVWRPGLMSELVAAAGARGIAVGLWDLRPEMFGAPDATVLVSIDVRAAAEAKLRALAAHRTQFGADHLLAALPLDLATDFLGRESWAGSGECCAARLRALLEASS